MKYLKTLIFALTTLTIVTSQAQTEIVREAESANMVVSPMKIYSKDSASGGRYVATPTSESGRIMFLVSIPTSGKYRLSARVKSREGSMNSLYVSVDSSPKATWHLPILTSYAWTAFSPDLVLSAGSHQLWIYGREPNTEVDVIKLTLVSSTPTPTPTPAPTPTPTPTPTTTTQPPTQGSFDLLSWYLSIPTDTDGSGTADSISETQLANGYQNSNYFWKTSTGALVFKCPIAGFKTSTNTSYTRSELREMLRRGNTSISTQGVNKNNWVFSSAPSSDQLAAGGIDGTLEATLAVNHVTTTGDSSQVGRVIVGQIHANDAEPIRLYYRKLPGHTKGSIYFAHEPLTTSEVWYEMIGSRSSTASDPADGVALNEMFSYRINVVGNSLTVTIMRAGKPDVTRTMSMSGSGYDRGGQYMYFKAGVYNQNNTGTGTDYVQATFYSLKNSHK